MLLTCNAIKAQTVLIKLHIMYLAMATAVHMDSNILPLKQGNLYLFQMLL